MIVTLVALIAMLATGDFSWLASDTSHVKAQAPRFFITPEEPVTLTLALIGIGTIAAYLAVGRVLWRRRNAAAIVEPLADDERDSIEQPSRGAA